MAHFGEQCEMDYRRKRTLRFAVLGHLLLYSPKLWDTVYLHFKFDRDSEIEATLKDLGHKKYIEVGEDKMVRITASGLRYLEEKFDKRGDA